MLISILLRYSVGIIISLFLVIFTFSIYAAPGNLDPNFGSNNPSRGANNSIRTIAIQSDSKILIGGLFTGYTNTPTNYLARIDSGGMLDPNFTSVSLNGSVTKILIQSDGKILVAGAFTSPTNNIIRLNSDGTRDTIFDIGLGFNSGVLDMALQSDGKIVAVGGFTTYSGTTRNRIARLHNNGSLDISFDPGLSAGGISIDSVSISGSMICIGGVFTSYGGFMDKNNIACLNAAGGLDSSWYSLSQTGANSNVSKVLFQRDGKLLIGGDFSSYNGDTSRQYLARITSDGTLDSTFNANPTTIFVGIHALALDSNNKIIVGGNFGPGGRVNISRITTTGAIDNSFVGGLLSGPTPNLSVRAIAIQPDGNILIGGDFTTYSGVNRNRIARLIGDPIMLTDSTPDSFSFTIITGQFVSTQVESNIILLTGINTGINLSTTLGQYQISTDVGITYGGCTSLASTGYQGDYVKLCQTTPATTFTTGTMTITAGTYTTGWSVRTRGSGNIVGLFTKSSPLNLSQSVSSNSVTLQTSGGPWAFSVSEGFFSKNGGNRIPFTNSVSIDSGDVVILSGIAPSNFSTNKSIIATITGEGQTVTTSWILSTLDADTTPDSISFTSIIGQQTGISVVSNEQQITGINTSVSLSIVGTGGYQTSPDGVNSWSACSSSSVIIIPGTYVRLCQTTSTNYDILQTSTLTVGSISTNRSTRTHGWVYPFSFGGITAYSGEQISSSPIQNISILGGPWTMSINNGEYTLNNGISRSNSTITLSSNPSIIVRGIALPMSGDIQTVSLSFTDETRTQQGSFGITTIPNYDRRIDTTNVSFISLTGVSTGSSFVSNIVLITGIEAAIPVYTLDGGYQTSPDGIGGRSSCGNYGQVIQGDYVRLCQTSSSLYNTQKTTTIIIGQGVDQITRTRHTTTHGRIQELIIGPVPIFTFANMPITSDSLKISSVGGPRSISVIGGYYSLDNGANWSNSTAGIYSGQSLIIQGFADPIVGMNRTITISLSDGIRTQTSSRIITTIAIPPPAPSTIVDVMINAYTSSMYLGYSGDVAVQTIGYIHKTGNAWIATGLYIDLDPGLGYRVVSINRPSQTSPLNTAYTRISLPNLGPGATGSVIITGIIQGVSGSTVAMSTANIYSSSMNDPNRYDNTRSTTGIVIISTGISVSSVAIASPGLNTNSGIGSEAAGGISPLLVLDQLQSKHQTILSKTRPPLIMSDVVNNPNRSHLMTMINNGIMLGSLSTQGSSFYPERHLTRAEYVTIVGRILSLQSFASPFMFSSPQTRFRDVGADSSYARFVQQLDDRGWIDLLGIGKSKEGILYFNPHNAVTQSQFKKLLIELISLRGYNISLIDALHDGSAPVSRGEAAYLLAELVQQDPQMLAGDNYRLLSALTKRLQSFKGDLAGQRLLTQRILSAIQKTAPEKLQAAGLMVTPLIADITDSLQGFISSRKQGKSLYSESFEALVESWSK